MVSRVNITAVRDESLRHVSDSPRMSYFFRICMQIISLSAVYGSK